MFVCQFYIQGVLQFLACYNIYEVLLQEILDCIINRIKIIMSTVMIIIIKIVHTFFDEQNDEVL